MSDACPQTGRAYLLRVPRLHAGQIPKLPAPVRTVARTAIWTYGTATAFARPLPDFLILGAQKAGTTALFSYLRRHPSITGPAWKEVSFFDRHYARGTRWYRGQFPLKRASFVGEASPSYLLHPLAPERVRSLVPDARLITLLRNPVDRAYSHYQHEVALGREPLSFEEALAAEDERLAGEVERMLADPRYFSDAWWDHTYFTRGLYAQQLERWYAVFPRDQLLLVPTEELGADPAGTYARIVEFIGAPPHDLSEYPRVFERDYAPMEPAVRTALEARYAAPNARLYALLERDLAW
jgi:hypothetical protein